MLAYFFDRSLKKSKRNSIKRPELFWVHYIPNISNKTDILVLNFCNKIYVRLPYL